MNFEPDYMHVQNAANNRATSRLPLYEHNISNQTMEEVLGKEFGDLMHGDLQDKEEYFRHFCEFHRQLGYDAVSFECCIGQSMPHSGLLGGSGESVLQTYQDFERYPWDEIPERYFSMFSEYFQALKNVLPPGMKAIGGVGNGIFEAVQEITGFMHLAFISADDPEMYRGIFNKVGEVSLNIWTEFMKQYSDMYCVLRFGDDLGYKSNTLLSASDLRRFVIPEYAKIIELIHSYDKPFLFHSCGNICEVMPDIINIAKIDAKHSNEDQIALFPYWVEEYGKQIGNFGGIDTDALCRLSKPEIREYVLDVLEKCKNAGGFAFGSGNSIPNYVPTENYVAMVNTVRDFRGD